MIPDHIQAELDRPCEPTAEQLAYFRENGFVRIEGLLPHSVIAYMDAVISAEVDRLNTQRLALEERDTYGKAFLQIMNIWTKAEEVKRIVMGRRVAMMAAKLLEVQGVRLYHDQALYKEPGGGHTPWHADQYYWPLSSDRTVTAWIPLQDTPLELGPLEFSAGSHALTEGRDKEIGDESQALLQRLLSEKGFHHVVEPFAEGDVSFHLGWLYHRAGPNVTDRMRKVMTMIYMDADMRLVPPVNRHQQADWDAWCPGVSVGATVASSLNPVIYP
jgi:ectoine hydroxylase-related dioxygenase (phytanoyl-CoA dioxygenase family)